MAFTLIESQAALEDYLAALAPGQLLAVDTEFFRETTYYPKLGLVQLACGGRVACVDPLAFDARATLATVLLDDGIHKLFHSCSQDLEVLLQYLDGLPCPVYDTQVGAALLLEKDQISYAEIVARYTGVELEKSQTRTNWLRRPLSRRQLAYAAEDVIYLEPVYESLLEELERKQRTGWFEHDCLQLCSSALRFEPDFEQCWLRVKGTQRMSGAQLAIVDALARWREQRAVEMDIARKMVINDDCITAAALNPPTGVQQLREYGKLHNRLTDADLESALACIHQATRTEPGNWPVLPKTRQSAEQRSLIRSLMTAVENTATELGIAPSVLASRKDVEKLVEGRRDLGMLADWRRELIGEQLLSLSSGQ